MRAFVGFARPVPGSLDVHRQESNCPQILPARHTIKAGHTTLLDEVAATISRYRMFAPGQRVGIAVSGGADSVCLLHVLRELAPRWDLRCRVLHLNHKLRGRESDADTEFVRGLSAEFGFPFSLREVDVAAAAGNLEEAAREARVAFFRDEIATNVDRVALGHTRSDQAETVLFRFLRGAGTAGLAGIRPVTEFGLVRPLIAVARAQVEQFLTGHGIPWREDATNRSLEFARNRIRHELLPRLATDWNPAIVQALAQTADWALAEESYWAAEIGRLAAQLEAAGHLREEGRAVLLETGCLRDLPLAVARRLVRRAMEMVKGDLAAIEFAHVNQVLLLADSTEGHGRFQSPDLDIIRSFNWLRLCKSAHAPGLETRNYAFVAPIPSVLGIPGANFAVSLEVFEKSRDHNVCDCVYNKGMVWVDQERLSGPLVLRNWRPGDRYLPSGAGAEQKIKTLFQNFRIPLWERRYWPVLTDGESIIWARRFGPAACVAAHPGSRRLLKIEEIGIERGQPGVYNGAGVC
jgi:tRNA(Ile)-lysidine synthase